MAVVEHLNLNDGELYELHDENDRFGGLIVDSRLAFSLESEGVAEIVNDLGDTAVGGALAADSDH